MNWPHISPLQALQFGLPHPRQLQVEGTGTIAAENGKKDTLRVLNSGQRAAETAIMSTGFARFKTTPLILVRLSIERAGGQGECGWEDRGWLV